MPEKISICLNRGRMESLGNDDVSIDLIHDARHLCMRLRTDGIKAMSRGFSGGKQVTNFPIPEIAVEFQK